MTITSDKRIYHDYEKSVLVTGGPRKNLILVLYVSSLIVLVSFTSFHMLFETFTGHALVQATVAIRDRL